MYCQFTPVLPSIRLHRLATGTDCSKMQSLYNLPSFPVDYFYNQIAFCHANFSLQQNLNGNIKVYSWFHIYVFSAWVKIELNVQK